MVLRIITFVITGAVLASCVTTNPTTGGKMLTFISEEKEFELGHGVASKSIKEEGLYKEKEDLTKYYQDIARKLVDVTDWSDKPYDFLMLDSHTYNAWAIPGYINMYRGIFPYINSEAEMVFIMAHEAGHINARHTVRNITKATIANAVIAGAAIYVGARTNSSSAANAAYTVGAVGTGITMKAYSRAHENEADELGMRYMSRMGYDPREAYSIFEGMKYYRKFYDAEYAYFHNGEEPPKSLFYSLLLTHPEPEDRMSHVEEKYGIPDGGVRLSEGVFPATAPDDPQGKKRYFNAIDGMAFGPRLEQGVPARSVLYYPKKRIIWRLPEGFLLDMEGGNWSAYDDVKKTSAFIKFKRMKADMDAEEMLRIMYPKLRQLQPITLDGQKVYTGVQQWTSGSNIFSKEKEVIGTHRVFGIPGKVIFNDKEDESKNFVVVHFIAPPEKFEEYDVDFFEAMEGFKLLSKDESKKIEPLRVRIHKVKKGETKTELAERLPRSVLNEQMFNALNSMDIREEVIEGQLIKMVEDPNFSKF